MNLFVDDVSVIELGVVFFGNAQLKCLVQFQRLRTRCQLAQHYLDARSLLRCSQGENTICRNAAEGARLSS